MENKRYSTSVVIKFLVCSLVGIFLFFVPITLNGKSTIPLDHIVNLVLKVPYFKEVYGTIVILVGVFLPFYKKTWNKNIPKRLQTKNFITTDVGYFLFSI